MRWAALIALGIGAGILAHVLSTPPGGDSREVRQEHPNSETSQPPTKAPSFHPNGVAIGLSVVPGAIVCQDLATVHLVWDLYVNYWTYAMQDITSRGASHILRGPSAPKPDPANYGCSLLAPGTPVRFEHILPGIVHITAKSADGRIIVGVTQENMVIAAAGKQDGSSVPRVLSDERPRAPEATDQGAQLRAPTELTNNGTEITDESPFTPGENGVGFPSCVYCPTPPYSEEARAAGISGTVTLQIVIEPDGHATDVQIVKGLGLGLDERAIQAVRNWRFYAAVGSDGKRVSTRVPVQINFHLE